MHINIRFYVVLSVLSVFLALLPVCRSSGQSLENTSLEVAHFGVADGLSQGSVYSILEDSRGFMWFTSYEGLNRFDGHSFKVYSSNVRDSTALWGSNTIGLVEDPFGDIWTGTEVCLNRYRRGSDGFGHVFAAGENGAETRSVHYPFFADSAEVWYINDVEGVMAFDYMEGKKRKISGDILYARSNYIINSTIRTHDGKVWVREENGIGCLDSKNGEIEWYFSNRPENRYGSVTKFVCAFEAPDGILWFGHAEGVLRFDPVRLAHEMIDLTDYLDDAVADVAIDENGDLWLGTEIDGLLHFSPEKKEVLRHIRAEGASNRRLLNNSVPTIRVGREGLLWVNTDPEGINLLLPDLKPFRQYGDAFFGQAGFTSPGVRCFAEMPDGRVWVGTQEDGLVLFDPTTDRLVRQVEYGEHGFGSDHAAFVFPDQKGRLWVGTYTGLFLSENGGGEPFRKVVNRSRPAAMRTSNFIWHIVEAVDGSIVFSTDEGIYAIAPGGLEPRPIDTLEHIISGTMYLMATGELLVPEYENGFYVFDLEKWLPHKMGLERPKDLPHFLPGFNVKHFYHDEKAGLLWVATNTGLLKTRPAAGWSGLEILRHYARQEGLPSNYIYGILPGREGQLWMSTNRGISAFDPEAERFQNYSPEDGIQGFEFNTNAFLRAADGELYFGGTEGFNRFRPDVFLQNEAPPKDVQLTDFQVNGKAIGEAGYIGELDQIGLAAGEGTFTIHFAAIDYPSLGGNRYRVMLRGYDGDWLDLGGQRQVRYTQVPPGEYEFAVMAANRDGVWMENARTLRIRIATPWYRSWWAILAYAGLAGLLFFQYQKQRRRQRDLRQQMQIEQLEAERLRELDEVKNRFFTNITHEFRTPLTVMLGMAEGLDEKGAKMPISEDEKERMEHDLGLIRRNGEHLLLLVNQMLDLSKIRAGALRPELRQADIIGYLGRLVDSYHSLAHSKDIGLQFFSEKESLFMDFDARQLGQVMGNLLANALKFTPAFGKILVAAKHEEHGEKEQLEIQVRDTGTGIGKEDLPFVFDRFFQAASPLPASPPFGGGGVGGAGGTGIGLSLVKELVELVGGEISVKSALGKGSVFTLKIPVRREAERGEAIQGGEGIAPPGMASVYPSPLENGNLEKPLALVIEDNADVVYYLRSCLENDWQVLASQDGKTGFEMAAEQVPDIIISDVMMPQMDGYELCKKLKADPRTSHIPVLLLTARSTAADRMEGLSSGADAFLTKPFEKGELLVRLENFRKLREGLRKQILDKAGNETTAQNDHKTERENSFLDQVDGAIMAHLDDPDFSVNQLCRAVGMSRVQVHRKLKALSGKSTARYVRHLRLREARRLLSATELPVSEVAWKTGFGSLSWFAQAYREEYGESPTETRK